ncbi:MAG: hypothetical protein ABIY70_13735 [Capsulimonas sp.]|uniref:hypothetical protein n=1 Tax=Capsulimonas sp. TaxID=2494211 RepID=UPI003263D33D
MLKSWKKTGPVLAAAASMLGMAQCAMADSYDDTWMECKYITQCSCTAANSTTAGVATSTPAYGVLNDWRIGNGQPDFVQPGEAAIGAIGLLYGYHRLTVAGRSNADLDGKAKTALSGFFWSWARNANNQSGNGFPANIAYNTSYGVSSKGGGDARVTAEMLVAMWKYTQLSPNGDGANYRTQEYAHAHAMADFTNANLNTWTIDRSYAVAAFRCFAKWATSVGDTGTSTYYSNQANTISGLIANAQDHGSWHNYYDYLDGGGNGVYNGGINQTGFSPYEFNARPCGEQFAKDLTTWWDHGTAYNGAYLTVQSGQYAGGVHQWTPASGANTQVYPGSALQLADAEWKIANATGNYNNLYASAWSHYNFAKSAVGSSTGSGDWVNNATTDAPYVGGFIDWVNTANGARPASWQRFVDTSGYMIIATEELAFSSIVDFSS